MLVERRKPHPLVPRRSRTSSRGLDPGRLEEQWHGRLTAPADFTAEAAASLDEWGPGGVEHEFSLRDSDRLVHAVAQVPRGKRMKEVDVFFRVSLRGTGPAGSASLIYHETPILDEDAVWAELIDAEGPVVSVAVPIRFGKRRRESTVRAVADILGADSD